MLFHYLLWLEGNVTYCNEDVKTPHTRNKVKHTQLARLIKLCVLALGEVETSVYFLQHDNTTGHVNAAGFSNNGWHSDSCQCHARGSVRTIQITRAR